MLATPPTDEGPADFDEIRHIVGRMLVPVDLTDASLRQVQRAPFPRRCVPFIATHVVD